MKLIRAEDGSESGAERARWVQRYRESGLGLKQFANQHGLRAARLHYWTYRSGPACGRERKEAPIFREVTVPDAWNASPRWAAEIGLPEGIVVRLSSGAEVVWASALVESLRRPCSR